MYHAKTPTQSNSSYKNPPKNKRNKQTKIKEGGKWSQVKKHVERGKLK